jgi:crotonobetainyl-CoA:carnitine CoA-transferase CaiB-like acyl-CoA transferase
VSIPVADQTGAFMAAFGIVVALLHRERTGEGQEVNASLLGSQLALQSFNITNYLYTRRQPQRESRSGFPPLWNVYRGSDGKYFVLALLGDRWWPGVCQAIGEPELERDPRFDSDRKRRENGEQLIAHLDEVFARKTAREWVRCFQEHGLVVGPVHDYGDVCSDPQVLANDYIEEVEHPGHDPVRMVGVGLQFSKTPGRIRKLSPELGEHTRQVLSECGLSQDEVGQLEAEGVVRQARPGAG